MSVSASRKIVHNRVGSFHEEDDDVDRPVKRAFRFANGTPTSPTITITTASAVRRRVVDGSSKAYTFTLDCPRTSNEKKVVLKSNNCTAKDSRMVGAN